MEWKMDFSKYPKHMKVRGIDRTNILTDMDISNIVYTPVKVVEAMLDLLPKELWSNPDARFLDPCCKSGVFLERIYWRLEEGLKKQIPAFIDRSDHIITKQLFGLAISDETAKTSRGILYGTHRANNTNAFTMQFKDEAGNIKVIERTVDNNYYGYIDIMREKTGILFQDTVKEAFGDMKFDVIIGNPPYQDNVGGGTQGTTAVPLYTKFIDKANQLGARYISMIVPTRWYTGDGQELDNIRSILLTEKTKNIVDYVDSKAVFPQVSISGGVGYFLVDNKYKGKCHIIQKDTDEESDNRLDECDIFIRFKYGRSIISKIEGISKTYIKNMVYPQNPFGLITSVRGEETWDATRDIKVKSSAGMGYINRNEITKNADITDKFKVITGYKRNSVSMIINRPEVLNPKEVCTQTYMVIGLFDSEQEANNYATYVKTKLFRALINITLNGSNVTRKNYQYIPMQDFSKSWTDAELYAKYKLTQEEIDFIESMIKPME